MKKATVEIEGNWWAIEPAKRCEMLSRDYDGQCDFSSQQIKIYNALPFGEQVEAVIHEIMHAQQPEIREETVTRRAREITRALFKTGVLRRAPRRQ